MSIPNSIDDALVLIMPVVVKARPISESGGKRIFEVGVSAEVIDGEGDVITQKALLDSASSFLAKGGILDLDHISAIGTRYGIKDPGSYIIGKALEVKDLGNKETGIVGEINPPVSELYKTKADEFWESLTRGDVWKSSIYGFPVMDGVIDCRYQNCPEFPNATRFVVKAIDWDSLALTKTPVNEGISHTARILKSKTNLTRIVTAKAFSHELCKSEAYKSILKSEIPLDQSYQTFLPLPRNRIELLGHHRFHMESGACPHAGPDSMYGNSVAGFRDHFIKCCGVDYDTSDIHANALMHLLKRR